MTDWSTPRVSPVQLRHREGWRERILERDSPLRRLDWVLVAAATSLGVIGAVLVWSATRPRLEAAGGDPPAFLKRHCLNLLLGLALGAVAALVDYRMLRAYAPIVYAASCLGLIAVLTPLGSVINGSRSWIEVGGGFQIQPSEFAKVALVVGMAMILGEKR
ncbi:MAG TPA: FtsW/RodA/SpoVE family cell cycle protein, partial [Mycobacteriales bacterium]|nr:FtsW/RodA/SpoVE family cell cycle protein [Mycobacteriales bacterium]